jgi:hypothetical protein
MAMAFVHLQLLISPSPRVGSTLFVQQATSRPTETPTCNDAAERGRQPIRSSQMRQFSVCPARSGVRRNRQQGSNRHKISVLPVSRGGRKPLLAIFRPGTRTLPPLPAVLPSVWAIKKTLTKGKVKLNL